MQQGEPSQAIPVTRGRGGPESPAGPRDGRPSAEAVEPRPARVRPLPADSPPIDIHEAEDALVLEADMPGVAPESLVVRVEDQVLHVRGRADQGWPAEARPIRLEYRPRELVRSFILGAEVDRGRIAAELRHGVLRLRLPKAAPARPRRIEIKSPGR